MFATGDNVNVRSCGDAVVVADDGVSERLEVLLPDGETKHVLRRLTEYLPTATEIERMKTEIRQNWVPRCDPRMWGTRPVYPTPRIEEIQEDEMGD